MRLTYVLGAIAATCLCAAPVAAAEAAMSTPGMMMSSSAMAVMPDGQMGSMAVTDDAMAAKMMGMATPVKDCVLMMTDKDGKMSMVDTSSAEGKAECEKLAMMDPKMSSEGAMASPNMMPSSTVMAMMPDGHMGSMMMTDDAMSQKMMGMATPMSGCMMMMTDKNDMMSMVDTSSADGKAECEKMATTKPAM